MRCITPVFPPYLRTKSLVSLGSIYLTAITKKMDESECHGFFNGSYFRKKNTDEIFNILMDASIAFVKDYNFKLEL